MRNITRLGWLAGVALAAIGLLAGESHAQRVKIVGTGSATCAYYLQQLKAHPAIEPVYFAWAQGYMSGILVRAPAGVDEDLDLTPPNFPIPAQAEFLRIWCSREPAKDFADAVQELYRTLRNPPG